MQHGTLTTSHRTEVLQVLNNERMNPRNGSIRVNRLSRTTLDYLKAKEFIKKDETGSYKPHYGRSTDGTFFNLQRSDIWSLGHEFYWHVVEPMLDQSGYAGFSITENKRWNLLNIWSRSSKHYTHRDEEQIIDVLCSLAAHEYIYFAVAGDVWEIQKRGDRRAA